MTTYPRIIIKSGGEMASGIAVRLYRAGFRNIVMLETQHPLAVRRAVSFCEAVHDGQQRVSPKTSRACGETACSPWPLTRNGS